LHTSEENYDILGKRGKMKLTERHIQPIIMNWAMENKKHEWAVPGSTIIVPWEADVLSVTKTGLIHEFEIKLNIYDFRADAKKKWKHMALIGNLIARIPAYFWYVTVNFDIEPPDHAGWIRITMEEKRVKSMDVLKEAPRLTTRKIDDWQRRAAARIMGHHLRYEYSKILR
jgi:hypothetical protein